MNSNNEKTPKQKRTEGTHSLPKNITFIGPIIYKSIYEKK